MYYVICYDIAKTKRRNRVANLLESAGKRANKSVFECELKKDELTILMTKISTIINKKEDSVFDFIHSVLIVWQNPLVSALKALLKRQTLIYDLYQIVIFRVKFLRAIFWELKLILKIIFYILIFWLVLFLIYLIYILY